MNIVLIAPPAAGKGSQAQKISKEYKIPHISTGDLLRNIKDEKILNELKSGKFISDELITTLIKERLSKIDCEKGYVLDGYPRNLKQAKLYENLLKELNKDMGTVIFINITEEEAIKRMVGRLVCPNCGAVFNDLIKTISPKEEGICDNCKTKLIKRADDTKETFIKRFETYEKETKPLIKYYKDKGLLHHVNSGSTPEITFESIKSIIGGAYDKH